MYLFTKDGIKYDNQDFRETPNGDLNYIGNEKNGDKIIMPKGIKNASNMFKGCTFLRKAPTRLPETIELAFNMFEGSGIMYPPRVLPESLHYADCMFKDCTNMILAPKFSGNTLESAWGMFEGCTALLHPPRFPDSGIYDCERMFAGCASLTVLPELPEGTKIVDEIFRDCKLVCQTVKLPASVISFNNMYKGCSSIKTTFSLRP